MLKNKETLLYIHYTDLENTKQEIKNFAIQNADRIVEKICKCTDVVARLFIEYFCDGGFMDFYAKIGTAAQKEALGDNLCDYPGDYPSDILGGDNNTLKVMVTCADNNEINFFQYAVDIMAEYVREKAVDRIHKTDDFKFLCLEYD